MKLISPKLALASVRLASRRRARARVAHSWRPAGSGWHMEPGHWARG